MFSVNIHLLVMSSIFLKFDLVSSYKDLPKYFPKCSRNDPEINKCLLQATDTVKPFLQKGVPELNIPPISPFHIPQINLQQGTDTLSYKSTLNDVVITGLDNYKFTTFEFDPKKLYFTSTVDMGFLNIRGNYTLQGKILSIPIKGNGMLNTNITNSNGTLTQQAKLVQRKGITYLEPEKTVINIQVTGNVQTDYNGLFSGNEILAKATSNMVRENLKEIIDEISPAVSEVFTRISEGILFKSIFKVPYDILYPIHKK